VSDLHRHVMYLDVKIKNPPAKVSAVGWLQSCSKELFTNLAFHPYRTPRPSPSFVDDNNRQP
jgi:hypothetical protein